MAATKTPAVTRAEEFTHPDEPFHTDDGEALVPSELSDDEFFALIQDAPPEPQAPPPSKALKKKTVQFIIDRRLMSTKTLLNRPDPDWFVEGLIPEFTEMVLHGDPGCRKTFIMLDLMAHAAHDKAWHGRKVKPGNVLYVLGEGVSGVGKRLRALAVGMGIDPYSLKIDWMPEPLNLFTMKPEHIPMWLEFISARDYKYVVFDTLHKNTYGMDENSAAEMGVAFSNAKAIAPEAARIFVHHDTKSGKSPRGSGSISGDVDVVIHVKSTGTMTSNLKSDKIRDAESFDNLAVTFDADEESGSIYIKTVGSPAPSTTKRQLIVRAILAQPGEFTRSDVCCTVGDGGSTQEAYDSLKEDGSIYTEARANPKTGRGHAKMIQVLFVDEAKLPFEDMP